MRIGRLDRDLLGRYLWTYLVTAVFFLGLSLIMNVFSGLGGLVRAQGRIEDADFVRTAVGLYLTGLPFMFVQIAPFVTVTAAVVTVVRIRRANELVPMVAAGRSVRRVVLPLFVVAILLAVGLVVLQDEVLPGVGEIHRRCQRLLRGRDASLFTKDFPHLVDGAGTTFMCDGYDSDAQALLGVRVRRYRFRGRTWNLEARELRWRVSGPEGRGWYAVDGVLRPEQKEPVVGPEIGVRRVGPQERIRTDLKPREIDLLAASKDGMVLSSTQLRRLIRRHPARADLRLEIHGRRAFAAANFVLLLIALPFAFRGSGRSTVVGAGLCIIICALYFTLDTLVRDAALRGALHPLVAAYTPGVLFLGVGAALFESMPT